MSGDTDEVETLRARVAAMTAHDPTGAVLAEVEAERIAQHAKWGEQNHPDGTGGPGARHLADWARAVCKAKDPDTFWKILLEEVYEAGAESDPVKLRAELIQVAAVAVQWVEAIDRRAGDRWAKSAAPIRLDPIRGGGFIATSADYPASVINAG